MRVIKKDEDISRLEVFPDGKSVRNKWQWSWQNETIDGFAVGLWCEKIDQPGVCYCNVCGKTIVYGSSGKKAIVKHGNLDDHKAALRAVKGTAKMGGCQHSTGLTVDGLEDQSAEVKSVLGMFISQHCLPLSLAPDLLALSKRLSVHQAAVNSCVKSISRTCMTYTISHGIAESIKEELTKKLKGQPLSLNIDEATNSAGTKFLNVIVQYFDNDLERIVTELLATRESNISTSDNIVAAVDDVLDSYSLDWCQVVSVMTDNCNVMKGVHNGVEEKMRAKNINLLDIGGDTVHLVNNAMKTFFKPIDNEFGVQSLANKIYYDIEDSPKAKHFFAQIQTILYGKTKSIIRPVPTRFLQMHDVSRRLIDIWDSLVLFYSQFVGQKEKLMVDKKKGDIFCSYNLDPAQVAAMDNLLGDVKKAYKNSSQSSASKERKDFIILNVINKPHKSLLLLNLFKGMTEKCLPYVKKFQSSKPQVHEIHSDLSELLKEFLSGFIKPENIPLKSTTKMMCLDVADKALHLKDRLLSTGKYCSEGLSFLHKDKSKNGHWLDKFYATLRAGYIDGAVSMKSLPLTNPILKSLSFLSPSLQRNANTVSAISSLAKKLPNVILPSDIGSLEEEVRSYSVDYQIASSACDETSNTFRVDTDWWSKIFKRQSNGESKFPYLMKLVKALLTIFSGPVVESSFNVMSDILTDDRTNLTTHNFESLAIVKSYLSSRNLTATTTDISHSMKKSVIGSYQKYQLYLAKKAKKHNIQEMQPSTAYTKSFLTAPQKRVPTALPSPSTDPPVMQSNSKIPTALPLSSATPPVIPSNSKAPTILPSPSTISPVIPSNSKASPTALPLSSAPTDTDTGMTSTSTEASTVLPSPTIVPAPSSSTNKVNCGVKRKQQSSLFGFFSKKPKI